MNVESNFKVCSKELTGKQTHYCSLVCKNAFHQSYPAQKKRGLERKIHFVNSLGGKCSRCGYQKNLAALAFHHKGNKEFQIDVRALSNRRLDRILVEIAKCELLCHNCHSEVLGPQIGLSQIVN